MECMVLTDGNGDTMIKLLYAIGLSALICAGALLVFCGRLWLQGLPSSRKLPEDSIIQKFQAPGSLSGKDSQDVTSPLVEQATAYALYLNPPKPSIPNAPRQPDAGPQQPAFVPPDTTPKFSLLATTYYRSSPEKSLALVSEPGRGDRWIKKDERLGHFIVERIEKGVIFYRDGNQLHEMKVVVMGAVQSAQIRSELSTSAQAIKPDLRLMSTPQPSNVE